MNILFIFHSEIIPHNGGVQRVTDILAGELRKRGHHVFFISTRESHDEYKSVSGVQEHTFGYEEDKKKFLQQYLSVLEKHQIDIVINQEANKESLFLLKNTPKTIRKVTVFHNRPFAFVNYERKIKRSLHTNNILQMLFKYFCIVFPSFYRCYYIKQNISLFKESEQYSDKICLLSSRFFTQVKKYVDISDEKLIAINNPNTFGVPSVKPTKDNIILFVGRLCEIPKNVRDFISVWHILQQKNPNWQAKVIGAGPDKKLLEMYAQKLGCQRLSFEGTQRNVSDFYSKARFICLTSIYEGWGMTLTEGMAYGCIPCAYDTYESVHDIIDSNECGIVAAPLNPQDMADKIQQLIDEPKRLDSFSRKAHQKVCQFSVERIADQWENLFDLLLNENLR